MMFNHLLSSAEKTLTIVVSTSKSSETERLFRKKEQGAH